MKKSSIALLSAGVSACAVYTAVWFMQAREVEHAFTAQLEALKQDAAAHQVTFAYDALRVTGFPFATRTVILKPSLRLQDEGSDVSVQAERIDIASPVFQRGDFTVTLQGDLALQTLDDAKTQNYTLTFPTAPTLHITLNDTQQLQSIDYRDKGYVLKNSDQATLTQWDATEVSYSYSPLADAQARQDIRVVTSGQYTGAAPNTHAAVLDQWLSVQQKLGKTKLQLEASFTGPTDLDKAPETALGLDIREFSLQSDAFRLSLKGTLDKTKEALLPVALMTVEITPVNGFITLWADAANSLQQTLSPESTNPAAAPSATPSAMGEAEKAKIRGLLEALADKTPLENDHFVTTVRSDSNGAVNIGGKTLEEASAVFAKTFGIDEGHDHHGHDHGHGAPAAPKVE
jgi:Cu/Ag efflux protein CusF